MHLAVWPRWGGHDNCFAARDLRWDGHHERAARQDSCAAGHIQAHRACNTEQSSDEHVMPWLSNVQADVWLALQSYGKACTMRSVKRVGGQVRACNAVPL